jgi:hypothetical protein
MSGIAARLATLIALAGLTLAVTASNGTASSAGHTPILGVVPHADQLVAAPHLFSKAVRAAGPTTLTFDASYQTVIDRYFTDVAHDSTLSNNVYSVATQYTDGSGPVQYQSTVGGSYVAHDPLPASGCDDTANGLHDPYCLTDQQLQDEIRSVLTATGWHGGLNNIFFLMTPNGVGSCETAAGLCSTDTFCAYHSDFVDSNQEEVIYANEPYEGPYPGCTDASQGFPNNDVDSDTTVNTISHEHNEAITDPLGNGWIAADGSENGDLCAYGFGAQTGTGVDAYNQVINGDHYDLQQEWSNTDNGCIQHSGGTPATHATFGNPPLVYHGGPVMHTNTTYAIYWLPTARNTSPPAVTGTAIVNQALTTDAGSWADGGIPSSYQWQRCSSTGTGCTDIPGATTTTYQLTSADAGYVVRSTVRATNVNGQSPPAASTGALVIDVPVSTKAPHISGRAKVGKKLSGSHGSWTFPSTYAYQWLRCNAHGGSCSTIRHATHSTYKLTSHDVGHRLRLRVAATNRAGSAVAVSAASTRVSR